MPQRPATTTAPTAAADVGETPRVLTIGHSTRPLEEFIEMLEGHGVERLIDVRTVPRSRHNPQFNDDVLPASLKPEHIGYAHVKALGGFRHTVADSPNTGWRNLSFRGYADYMQTPEFAQALADLIELSRTKRVALMCAEAVPWRCHRSLVADALEVRGVPVVEIFSATSWRMHALTPFARVEGTTITYPPEQGSLL